MASNKTDFGGQNFPLHDVRNTVTQRKGNKMPGLQAVKGKPVDSEAIEMEEGDTKLLPPVRQSSEAASDAGAVGEHAKDEDMNRKVNIQENLGQRNPAVFSDTGDDADKDLKQEQRGAIGARLIGGDASDVRSSWADGQVGAEKSSPVRTDSKHGALTKTDSTVPSGHSALSITNHQGGDGAAIAPPSSSKGATYCCCWERCHACFSTSPDLAEHIRSAHVDSQHGEVFACLWRGCKVYNTPSSSPGWLQRHMLSHSGNKPFKCVVAGCSASFASQLGVARHVPSHFSQQSSSKGSGQSRSKEEPSSKAVGRRNRLRSRLRRSLPKPRDFFDARTMDAIRHKAICLNLATHIESLGSGHSVVFYSTVIARRKEDSGKVKVLLHWTPEDILPDAWVNETDRQQLKTKVVHLSQLAHDTALLLDPNVYRIFF